MNNTIIVHMTRSSAKCPICGKTFYHEPEHAYKIGHTNSKGGKLVCSYSCMRKWEKENNIKRRGDKKVSEPFNFIKVFVCDYIEDIEEAVNEYAKENKVIPLSASVTNLGSCVSAAVVFEKRWYSRG